MPASTPSWEGETSFRAAAQIMPGMVWTARPDGSLEWANDTFCATVGMSLDTLVDLGLQAILDPDERTGFLDRLTKCVVEASSLNTSVRLQTAQGKYQWHLLQCAPTFSPDGQLAHWVGTATNIDAERTAFETLKRDNEELEQDIFTQLHELSRSRSRLQTIFDACPDYLLLVRLAKDGALTYADVNPAAATLFDGGRQGVVGRLTDEVSGLETAANMEKHVRRALRDGKIDYETEGQSASKSAIVVQVVGTPIAYSNEEEGLVLFCGRDITEQRAAEDALRQSQKMEAVGQLTGGLAHDFNNLLTGIIGGLDLLQVRITQGRYDQVGKYVQAAQAAAERAAALTHRLLAFSRRQTLDPKAADTNALVSGMEELLRRTVGPEISLDIVRQDGLWTVLVDTSQLENALLNLCINARDAMPEGGLIIVETKNVRLGGRDAGERDLPSGDYVGLSVSDNGSGMSPGVAARIFDPFFTTKPLGSGTGLGLSMIYGFARQSGGNVRVHTSPGHGTTMRILLPRHFGEVGRESERVTLSAAPHARDGEAVLIVDDEHTIRSLASEVLADLGYHITVAKDGNEGLQLLQTEARFDVLVTDIGLPGGINGRQVAEAARNLRSGIKVLFVTGYAESAVFNHGHLAPGMQVLTKPFAMEALASRVRQLIDQP